MTDGVPAGGRGWGRRFSASARSASFTNSFRRQTGVKKRRWLGETDRDVGVEMMEFRAEAIRAKHAEQNPAK